MDYLDEDPGCFFFLVGGAGYEALLEHRETGSDALRWPGREGEEGGRTDNTDFSSSFGKNILGEIMHTNTSV